MVSKTCACLAIAIVVALVIIAIALYALGSGPSAEGFTSLIPERPIPYNFPSSCAPYNPNDIAHEEEQPLLYRCQHQCATMGPLTERPGESCMQQCVWGWPSPPPHEYDGTIGHIYADPWPRLPPQVHSTDAEWPYGVNVGNVWTGRDFAPKKWQKCWDLCGNDMVCIDDCVSTAAGTAYGL